MRNIVRSGAVVAFAAVLAGCGDAVGPAKPVPAGSVSFAYTADEAGSYVAAGAPLVNARGWASAGTWAAAGRSARYPGTKVVVTGYTAAEGARTGTLFAVSVPLNAAGTQVPIDVNCAAETCSGALLLAGVPPRVQDARPTRSCFVTAGVLHVARADAERVQGTFSGRGFCLDNPGTVGGGGTEFHIDGGAFD
ncbi:hypothetical protein, partial [Longimicrobium sp.]|uniref:hypothetical protein n=1 Tax=Longimicrobium sp. TaxID=2029185 RepID=UPI002F92B7EF